MCACAGESVEYVEQVVEARAEPEIPGELGEYIDLTERMANDPDAPVPARYHGLLKSYAVQGAMVGFHYGAPVLISVDRDWLLAASGEA